jgi:predicted DNA binding CopG/RHH family protein
MVVKMIKNKLDLNNFEIDEGFHLDNEELEMLDGVKGSISILDDDLVKRFSAIAKAQNKRSKQINMRLTEDDYMLAKAKAIEEGIPYQVLLASVIHKWLHLN